VAIGNMRIVASLKQCSERGMKVFSRYLPIFILTLTLFACAPSDYTVIRGATEAGPPEELILEETTARVYNCGAGGDVVIQTPAASIMFSDAVQWELGLDIGIGRDLALVALEGELAAKYGAEYKKSTQTGTGWQLPARPGEWIEYTIRWSEVWQPGSVILRRSGVEETVAYRYRKTIKSEIVGKRLLICDPNRVEVMPAATPVAVPPGATSVAGSAPPVQIVGYGYPPDTLANAGQRRAAALLAAELDAKRKLVEWLAGADIEAVTVVEEGEVTADVIRREIQAHLRGVTIVQQVYDEASGQAEVTLAPVITPE
jgi:hypothetical protein